MTLLGLLEREPSHGYDLKRDYDAWFGRGKPLSFGQLYATLARLDRDRKAIAGPGQGRRGTGPQALRDHRCRDRGRGAVAVLPAPPEPGLHSVLFTKVVLAVMLGRPADRFLDLQRAAHLQRMHELTELKRSDNVADVLLADHGLYHLEADLRWIDHTAARLDLLTRAVRR